jgi:4-amino-4-deoxy-L-arabinose transferase-like glycosyltransferase
VLRRHWPFALVLAAGAALRLACEIAYRPALFYSDSWGYLSMAHGSGIVSFAPLRPSGYPLVLKVLSVAGDGLTATTLAQHLAGLVTATLVYVTCRALGARRWLATAAGALVALDAWAIALEQYVLAEAFFALLLAACVWASLVARQSSRDVALAVAGLCLAGAALMRPVALFAAVAWLVWLVVTRPGRRPLTAGFAALVVPLLVYSLAHQNVTGTFGLTQAEGWFLYGRVGSIAKCEGIDVAREARALCNRPPRADHEGQSFFMFNRQSPARRAFGGISADSKEQARTNRILRRFAVQVIEERPGAYAKLVTADFLRFFRPGPHARYREDATVEFPASARIRFDDRRTRHRLFPGLRTHESPPAGALRAYGKVFHTSRPLVTLLTLLSLIALGLGLKRRDPRVQEISLPLGMALLMLLGAAATASFALRYLVPAVAEFAIAATLSLELLAAVAAGRRVRSASQTPPREANRR